MLALAIVGILTVAALSVTVNISRVERLERQEDGASALAPGLDALLRMDMVHADGYRSAGGGLELRARCGIDYGSLEAGHLPVTLKYRISEIGGVSWLVRIQEYRGRTFKELVCSDVSAFVMNSIRVTAGGNDKKTRKGKRTGNLGELKFRKIPQTVTIAIEFDRGGKTPLEFVYRTR